MIYKIHLVVILFVSINKVALSRVQSALLANSLWLNHLSMKLDMVNSAWPPLHGCKGAAKLHVTGVFLVSQLVSGGWPRTRELHQPMNQHHFSVFFTYTSQQIIPMLLTDNLYNDEVWIIMQLHKRIHIYYRFPLCKQISDILSTTVLAIL